MKIQERKNIIRNNLVFESEKPRPIGGQNCGLPKQTIIIKSEDLEIEIKVSSFRSGYKNKDFALLLMDLAIDELIK